MVDVLALNEQLFQADDSKDVEIRMSDGSVRAHSLILCASSEAISGMLKNGEARESKVLNWTEHRRAVGSFVLRLIYTGLFDKSDWLEKEKPPEAKAAEDSGASSENAESVPLEMLTGGLAIAKVYMLTSILPVLTSCLQKRLVPDTFNDIFTCALKNDVVALRLRCVRLVDESLKPPWPLRVQNSEDEDTNGIYTFERSGFLWDRRGVRYIKPASGNVLESRVITLNVTGGQVEWNLATAERMFAYALPTQSSGVPPADGWKKPNSGGTVLPMRVTPIKESPYKAVFEGGGLSPEAMEELAPLFPTNQHLPKRRRLTDNS